MWQLRCKLIPHQERTLMIRSTNGLSMAIMTGSYLSLLKVTRCKNFDYNVNQGVIYCHYDRFVIPIPTKMCIIKIADWD